MEEETKSTAPASGNDDSPASDQRQRIIDFGSAVSRSSRGNIYTLTIAGQVEGHQVLPETAKTTKYEHVMPLLSSLEQSEEIEGVLLLLNTVGGDIEAGLGIAELVAGMRKPTVSLVLGGGHSIGIPLAVAPPRPSINLSGSRSGTSALWPRTAPSPGSGSSPSCSTPGRWLPTWAASSTARRRWSWGSLTASAASATLWTASTSRSPRPAGSGRRPWRRPGDLPPPLPETE